MNLKDLLVNGAHLFPEKTALICGSKATTYLELHKKACVCASSLRAAGTKRGDCVCIAARNCAEYIELIFACSMLGAIPCLINWRISPVAMAGMLRETKAKIIFLSNSDVDTVSYFRSWKEEQELRIVVISDNPSEESDYDVFCNAGCEVFEPVPAQDSDTGMILFTSGTTGQAKGVMLSNKALMTQIFNTAVTARWSHNERFMCISPISHSISLSVLSCFCVCGTLILCPLEYLRDFGQMFKIMNEQEVTRIVLVPTVIERLVSYAEQNGIERHPLRVIGYGGSPISPQLIERCAKVFDCSFHQGYGMTEAYGTVTALLAEDHKNPELLHSVGRSLMGCRIRIVDDAGKELPWGEKGEIIIQSESLMTGYLGRPELTASVIKDNWYHSGDVGYMNEKGYLFITGRKSDMIITGGENVYPSEVEACIRTMTDKVSEVFVTGIEDPTWGEIIVAAVVKKPGSNPTEAEIANHCREHLGSFKKPKKIKFVTALPINPSGKVSRQKVAELFSEQE